MNLSPDGADLHTGVGYVTNYVIHTRHGLQIRASKGMKIRASRERQQGASKG